MHKTGIFRRKIRGSSQDELPDEAHALTLTADIANDKIRIVMSLVPQGYYLANSCNYVFAPEGFDLEALLGILNSRLVNWFFRCFSTNSNVNGYEIDNLPIPYVSQEKQEAIKTKVLNVMHKKNLNHYANASTVESEIDRLVYQLYGLTEEEITVIERS